MDVVIFGTNQMAQLAYYYLSHDSIYNPVAFCVDEQYKTANEYLNLPVIVPSQIKDKIFAPIYDNIHRKKIYENLKSLGFEFISYVSTKALTWNSEVGENCFILEGCNLQPFSKVQNNVMIWSFSHLGHHSVIKEYTFVSGNVVIAGNCTINSFCYLGTNCSTKDGIHLGIGSHIGMDCSLQENTSDWSIYRGNKANKIEKTNNDKIRLNI